MRYSDIPNGVQFTLTLEQLAKVLNLPEGAVVTSAWDDGDWVDDKLRVFVHHPDMPTPDKYGVKEVEAVVIEMPCGHSAMHFVVKEDK